MIIMDTKRALEIVNSLGVIEVFHQGSPVWIENIEENYAVIKYLNREQGNLVPIDELKEIK
jgi:small acid-soluble spore protein H (minor)